MKRNRPLGLVDSRRMTASPLTERDRRFIRLHADWLRRTGATDRTIFHRRENLRRLAERLPCDLLDATPELLDTWQSSLAVCPSSRATYTNHVIGFYRWATDNGHLEHDPAARLPRPRIPQRVARPIPESDLKVALECAPEPMRTWLVLAAFMGLRAAEVAGIRREDVTDVDGRLYLSGIGKGQKPFRLPVPVEVAPSLRAHLSGQPGPLWRTAHGRPVTPGYVTGRASEFFKAIGMPYTLHWCRHFFGTQVYRQTRDLLLTMTVLRHSSPNTTRLYVEQMRADEIAAVDQLSARLRAKAAGSDRPPPPRKRRAA